MSIFESKANYRKFCYLSSWVSGNTDIFLNFLTLYDQTTLWIKVCSLLSLGGVFTVAIQSVLSGAGGWCHCYVNAELAELVLRASWHSASSVTGTVHQHLFQGEGRSSGASYRVGHKSVTANIYRSCVSRDGQLQNFCSSYRGELRNNSSWSVSLLLGFELIRNRELLQKPLKYNRRQFKAFWPWS